MPRGRRHIQFEGYFAENAPGIFRYVQISRSAAIPERLTPENKAILEDAGAVLESETS